MKFADLNIDCLEAILDYLEFKDLVNAADSNKRINHAAKFIFARKYRKYVMEISGGPSFLWAELDKPAVFQFVRKRLAIYNLKLALTTLRCFGCVMKKITIPCYNESYVQYIAAYTNQFCAGSITEISMWNIPEDVLDNFKKPFIRIEKLRLAYFRGQHHLAGDDWINRLFPKIKHLHLYSHPAGCSTVIANRYIEYHFPTLEYLKIDHGYFHEICPRTCGEKILAALKLNPHLKKLTVQFYPKKKAEFDANILQNAEEIFAKLP